MQQTFEVKGMSCGHCVRAVSTAIHEVDPQARVDVDLEAGRVSVESERSRAALAEAIDEAGYEVAG